MRALTKDRVCKPKLGDGKTRAAPSDTCRTIKRDYPDSVDGVYFIRGKNGRARRTIRVYCKMEGRDGGGWFLAIKSRYNHNQGGRGGFSNSEQNSPEGRLPNWAQEWNDGHITKYSDGDIRNLAGPKWDLMADTGNGWNPDYSTFNWEYVVLYNYTASYRSGGCVPKSSTLGPMGKGVSAKSWSMRYAEAEPLRKTADYKGRGKYHALSKDRVASPKSREFPLSVTADGYVNWEGEFQCGGCSGAGIYCNKGWTAQWMRQMGYDWSGDNGPQGGYNCLHNDGDRAGASRPWWGRVHFEMYHGNTDSYIYVCSGAQHTSSYYMMHRWWFREADSEIDW